MMMINGMKRWHALWVPWCGQSKAGSENGVIISRYLCSWSYKWHTKSSYQVSLKVFCGSVFLSCVLTHYFLRKITFEFTTPIFFNGKTLFLLYNTFFFFFFFFFFFINFIYNSIFYFYRKITSDWVQVFP